MIKASSGEPAGNKMGIASKNEAAEPIASAFGYEMSAPANTERNSVEQHTSHSDKHDSDKSPSGVKIRENPHKSGKEALEDAQATFKKSMFSIGAFSAAINILMLSVPIYLFQLSDRVLTSQSFDTLMMLSIVACGALVMLIALDYIRRYILTRVAMKIETLLGGPVLAAALNSANTYASRDVQALRDMQQLRSFITGPVILMLFDTPLTPIYFLAGFLIHPVLGCIMILASFILLGLAFLNEKLTRQPFAQSGNFGIRANMQAAAQARNAQVICAMGMAEESIRIWGKDNSKSLKHQVLGTDRNLDISSLSRLIRLITQIGLLGAGAYLAMAGELTGGMMVAAALIASRALAPIEGAIEGWRSCIQAKTAYERIRHLLENSSTEKEHIILPKPEGRVSVEKILYIPQGTKRPILNGVSFALEPGSSLAIVGPSGGGKSTLAKMIVGCIAPTAGAVRLDFMDIRNWDRRQFGENIGYLPQDIELFPGTIKANIARLRDDIPDEAITRAAKLAGIHEMISMFPEGYETEIGIDGSPLSGGQKQQIALARAFFNEPRLVVLDEPNANLDPNGEMALEKAIMKAGELGITVILVTQRPSILRCVNRILVIKNGQVAALGDRDQLLARLSGKEDNLSAMNELKPEAANQKPLAGNSNPNQSSINTST